MTRKNCQTCKHAGWDPDGNYCAAPAVLKKHPYGRAIGAGSERNPDAGVPDICAGPTFPHYAPKAKRKAKS